MDVPKNCVAKRTRYQRQKAEEELLEKAKILKAEKDQRKTSAKRSAVKPKPKRSLKGDKNEASSSDVEILSEEKIPPDKRIQIPKSRIAKLHETIVIDQIPVPGPGHDSEAANQKQEAHKHIGAPSGSISVSSSGKDDFSCDRGGDVVFVGEESGYNKGDDEVFLGEESDDNYCKEVENHDQGRQAEIGNGGLCSWEFSSEGDGGESDQSDSQGGENQNQGRTMESSDDSESTSASSSEEDRGESDDDYNGDESENSDSESDDDLSYCREGNLERGTDKDNGVTSSVKKNPVGEKIEYKEDEVRVGKRTMNNEREDDDCRSTLEDMDLVTKKRKAGNVHEESGKKRKILGLYMWVDGTRRDDKARKSRLERLRPRRVSESGNAKLDSGKPACPIKLFDSDANESDDANESVDASDGDHFSQKSNKKCRIAIGKQAKRKNRQSKDIDIMNILVDSVWEKGDELKERLPPLKEKDHNENALPLKFRFEDEDPAPLEKEEEEREVDNLFADLEMGWTEEDIGSTKLSKEDNDDAAAKVIDPVESCWLGHHSLILDETIGVICKYCGAVQQEMKHVLPDLKMRTRRRSEWFDFHNDESSLSFEFQFGESASGYHHAFIDTEGPVLNIIPAYLRRQMYPHQLDGFQFLWKNIAGATMIEDLKTPFHNGGTGCIISHAPGTGKSFLTIVFLLTFMEVHPTCRPVIIAPVTMLRAWANELKRWKVNIPFHNLNDAELSGKENVMAANIIQQLGSSMRDRKRDRDYKRMVKLYSWTKDRSILGIAYSLFEKLAGEHRKGNHAERFRKILLELPGILILDEGHIPRNQNSLLWKALTKVQTGRRIILSGTPFQNNFNELYNTFCLVNPKFAEGISLKTGRSDAKRKSNPAKGRWASLTSSIGKNTEDAVEELRVMMDPFVHVHKGTILQESLPGLRDTLIELNPTDFQKQLVGKIHIYGKEKKKLLREGRKEDNFLEEVYLVSLVSVHPSLVAQHEKFFDHKSILEEVEMTPEAGVKTQVVIEIVRLSNARDEKVLIFSEFIDPLNFLMKQLTSYFSWEEGKQVLYMDGKLEDKQRQLVIKSLNAHNSEAKVLLASIKACSEGINLVGASRVVLLDVVWNPSVERQAISRAYRLGQKKIVYVYHLIMSGTMEIEKYRRQANKDRISELVFPSPEGHDYMSKISGSISGDNILDAMVHHKKLRHIFKEILPQPKESNVFENFDFVTSAKSK